MKPQYLGPGLLLAATSIGASHILLSPEAGARFEYRLVWLILLTHLVKYPAFACAPRYVAARGESLLDAYARAPGPRRWPIWMGLADMTLQAVGLVAALIGLTASFLRAALGGPGVAIWSLLLAALILALLRLGRYSVLRRLNLVLILALALGTVLAFLAAAPPARAFPAMLRPGLPPGSLLLASAILGFMPTSVAVSIWYSLWSLEQGRGRTPPRTSAERLTRLRQGLFDLRLGYALSALVAVCFVSLGAVLLHPRGLVPQGPEVALVLSQLYTLVLGEWMRPLFLALAFAALFTTCYAMMDGFPRSFVAALSVLRGEPSHRLGARAEERRGYWIFLLAVTFGGMAILAAVPDPAFLVKAVGATGLVLSPIYFGLNLWAVRRQIDDPSLRPGRLATAAGLVGIVFMTLTAVLLLKTTFLPGETP